MVDEDKDIKEEKKGLSTEVVIGFGITLILIVMFFIFFIGTGTKDPKEKIKEMGYNLQNVVRFGEGKFNQKSTQWDYSLKPNEFFKKYMDEYMNYSHMIERNLEYNDQDTVFYIYFVDDSYMVLRKNECMEFHYDANGSDRPNVKGQDQYIFYLCPQEYATKNNFINNPNIGR